MNSMNRKRTQGITLIEALIALAVLAFGLLGIAKLHSELMHSTAVSKARTEAVQLAEAKIEEMRNLVLSEQHKELNPDNDCVVRSDTYTGVNALFNWETRVCGDTPYRIEAGVSWQDARGNNETVELASELGWASRALSARLAGAGGAGASGIQGPSGAARRGGTIGENAITVSSRADDGTEIRYNDETGEIQLVKDGVALLTITATDSDGNPPNSYPFDQSFSTIDGRIYAHKNMDGRLDPDLLRIEASAGAFCTIFDKGSPGDKPFKYRCYMGEGWRGGIGVTRLDSQGLQERVCVGDPAKNKTTDHRYSRHATVDITRRYEGYLNDNQIVGIGQFDIVDGAIQYQPVALGTGGDRHHFLLTRITGSQGGGQGGNTDETALETSCATDMAGSSFSGNNGRWHCFTPTCPDGYAGGVAPQTIVSGVITTTIGGEPRADGFTLVITENGSPIWNYACEVSDDQYECTIPLGGVPGAGVWDGYFEPLKTPEGAEITNLSATQNTGQDDEENITGLNREGARVGLEPDDEGNDRARVRFENIAIGQPGLRVDFNIEVR